MTLRTERGLTLIEVLVAIVAAIAILLGLLFWSSAERTRASRCQNNLGVLQYHYQLWRQACASNDSATQAQQLTAMNTIITQWNAGECKKYGTLPAQPATCPELPP